MTRVTMSFPLLLFLFLCALAAQGAALALYLGAENAPAFWDYAMYANMAIDLWQRGGWDAFAQSFAQKYNMLYALPSLGSFSFFAPSRDVFIVTNGVVYGAAYQGAAALLLRRLYGFDWPRAVFAAFAACMAVPFLWYPLVQGYPDMGAAAAMVLALALSLGGPRTFKRALAIGACVGLAVLFRRHYAYAGLALLAASAVIDTPRWRTKGFWLDHAARGLTVLAVLAALEPSYLAEMVRADYAALYSSYGRSAPYILFFAAAHAGAVLLAVAATGWTVAWCAALAPRPALRLAFLAPVLWLALWALGPAQAGQHYLIALLPVLFIVPIGAFCARGGTAASRPARVALAALLAINAVFCLALAPRSPLPSDPPSVGFFGQPRAPWTRGDLAALKALARHVAETTTDKDTVVVSGSSFVFNQDLVRTLYTDVLKDPVPAYRFLPAPESDGDQDPPHDVFAAATVFVVADPPQFHLDPARQKSVAALAGMFPPTGDGATLFAKDAATFVLDRGVRVSIWRRESAWSPFALRGALARMSALSPPARPWVVSRAPARFGWAGPHAVEALLAPHKPTLAIVLNAPLAQGAYRFAARAAGPAPCAGLALWAFLSNGKGRVLQKQKMEVFVLPALFPFSFSVPEGGAFLSFEASAPLSASCFLALHDFSLTPLEQQTVR